jgi:hypothetical protein
MPEFHADEYVNQLKPIRDKFQKMYDERMPILSNYEDFAKTTLDQLIGETVPAARDTYRQAANYTAETSDFLKKSMEYDTPERRAAASGKAMTDVTSAAETARQNSISQLESFGIDPSQTRGAAMDQNIRVQAALEAVRAGRAASSDVETKGREYTAQALGLKGDALSKQGQASESQAHILGSNVGQAINVGNLGMQTTQAGQSLINSKQGAILSSADLKQAEKVSAQAAKAGKGASGWAGIGQFAGMAVGAGLGAAGGPMGMMAGAQIGGALGGAAGGAAGGGGGASSAGFGGGFSGLPTSWGGAGQGGTA